MKSILVEKMPGYQSMFFGFSRLQSMQVASTQRSMPPLTTGMKAKFYVIEENQYEIVSNDIYTCL